MGDVNMNPWDKTNKVIAKSIVNADRPKIAICVPYAGNWNPEWTEKSYVPLRYVPVDWCDKYPFLCKVPSIPVARDILVRSALKANCDYLFFLDSDIVFENPIDPNAALHLLYQSINKDRNFKTGKIVSGLYRAKQAVGFHYAAWMKTRAKGYTPIKDWTGNWLEVSVTGLGCTLIDMMIFKELPRPWFRWEMQDDISEDFSFLELAKSKGYDTHIFADVKLSHLGTLKVKCDGSIVTPEM